jgi:hypothetical protein
LIGHQLHGDAEGAKWDSKAGARCIASFPGIARAVANLVKASVTTMTYVFFFVDDLIGPHKSQCTHLFGPRGSGNGTNGGGLVVFFFVVAWQVTHMIFYLLLSWGYGWIWFG